MLHLHDVGMLQHAEELHLSQDPGRIRHVLEDVGDLLDGHLLPGLVVRRRAHHPVASLADDLVDGETVSLAVLGEEALVVHRRGRRHFVQPPPFVTAVSSKAGWSERPLRLELDRVRRSVARPKGFAHSRLCARPRTRSEPARMPSPARSRPPKGSTQPLVLIQNTLAPVGFSLERSPSGRESGPGTTPRNSTWAAWTLRTRFLSRRASRCDCHVASRPGLHPKP